MRSVLVPHSLGSGGFDRRAKTLVFAGPEAVLLSNGGQMKAPRPLRDRGAVVLRDLALRNVDAIGAGLVEVVFQTFAQGGDQLGQRLD